jgi:hypothetical protein
MSLTPSYGNLPTVIDPTAWAGRTTNYLLDPGTVQNQLQAQLNLIFQRFSLSISTYVFPKFDFDTWWAGPDIAFVLISYAGADHSKPKSTSAMHQETVQKYRFTIEARQVCWPLTGPGSVYYLLQFIQQAMGGFQVPGTRRGYFTEERFNEQDPQGRVWLYDITYNVVFDRQMLQPIYDLANLVQENVAVTASIGENVSPTEDLVIEP